MNTPPILKCNLARLKANILELGSVGADHNGGLHRTAFSEHDMQGREWFKDRVKDAGLDVGQDGAANISGYLHTEGGEPAVATGSHLDTVPGGGKLDGALGVLAGLEALQTIKESGLPLKRPLEVINFSDEEGRFGGLFGSQALAGVLSRERIEEAVDLEGVKLVEAMERHGLQAFDALHAARDPGRIHAFLELHIEQGPVLENLEIPVGVVSGVAGLVKWNVRFQGKPAHSGTTPMDMRVDPLQGVAEFICSYKEVLKANGTENAVCNIGRIEARPGVANVVPKDVEFTFETRDISENSLNTLQNAFLNRMEEICEARGLLLETEIISRVEPKPCASHLVELLRKTAGDLKMKTHLMPSGAIHDSQIVGEIAPSAMLFVPSVDGRSHCPEERTEWEQIGAGCDLLTNSLYRLAI